MSNVIPLRPVSPRTISVDDIAAALDGKKSGRGWTCRCPVHDDRHASLSISVGDRVPVILYCHAGCESGAVIAKLQEMNLWPQGCTLDDYAAKTRLPIDFLRSLRITDTHYRGIPAINIPYLDSAGVVAAVRVRRGFGELRFAWRRGAKPCLYGLDRLRAMRAEHDDIFLVEGESDAHVLWCHDRPALGVPGNTNWREERDAHHLDGFSKIYVCIEPGKSGEGMLDWISRSAIRNRVWLVWFRDLKDPAAIHARDPDRMEKFDDLVAGAEAWADYTARQPQRPRLDIGDGLSALATQAEDALLAAKRPIFQFGVGLVMPVEVEAPASAGRMTRTAILHSVTATKLRDLLSQDAIWVRQEGRGGIGRVDPPRDVCEVLLERIGHWRFPGISGIATAPTLRPDGSVLTDPGYDAATRLYYHPGAPLALPTIGPAPSRADADAALAHLKRLLAEFPFVSAVDRAVALSALMTPILRGMLPVVPLHAFSANEAGTGKSYLCDLPSLIMSGRACAVMAAGRNPEETEKRLAGLLLEGRPLNCLDNVTGDLGGDLLCQAVERPALKLRPLGTSALTEIANSTTILANGNNLRVHGDMARRTLLCRLDASVERPELRQFARDPAAAILADRGLYIGAVLTIALAYRAAGQPDRLPPLASYGAWSDNIRSALVWLGEADPAASIEQVRADDPSREALLAFLGAWEQHFGLNARTTVSAMLALAEDEPEWRRVLLDVAGGDGKLYGARLGKYLHANEGRIIGGAAIRRAPAKTRGGTIVWRLAGVSHQPTGRQENHPQGVQGVAGDDFAPTRKNANSALYVSRGGLAKSPQQPPAPPASSPGGFIYRRRAKEVWEKRVAEAEKKIAKRKRYEPHG